MQHLNMTLADEAATLALGKSLAHGLQPGLCVYLHGDLGAGKTALTRAVLHAAGHQGQVKSPTYTLAEPYQIMVNQVAIKFMHFDLYRMISPDEFIEAGFRDEFNQKTICFVEWPEKGDGVLPAPDLDIYLDIAEHGRRVQLRARSVLAERCLDHLNFAPNL